MGDNNYLKRGKGKNIGDIKKDEFYDHYKNNAKLSIIDRKTYNRFTKTLLVALSIAIVEEGMQLKFGKLGYIRVQAKKLHLTKRDGTLSNLKVDWAKTWEFWERKYEGKTRDEITEIKNKQVLYFDNEHTGGEFYRHIWDNFTSPIRYKTFFNFKPSRQYSRLISKVVKDPKRKVFYYG